MGSIPPYEPKITVNGGHYFPAPYSMVPLQPTLRYGLIPVGMLAILSVGTTLSLITFILWRLVTWRLHYDTFLGYNQYVLLVLNLLIADLQQSSAYLFSWHWIRFNRILAPSPPCFAQAWLLHSGDVSSGFFVLAIAVHTYLTAVHGMRIGQKTFTGAIVSIWAFAYFLTALGVGLHRDKYFVRAGAWCWVSEAFESDRLALHYVWVFFVQFGTIVIYIVTFFMIRRKTKLLFEKIRQGHNANMTSIMAVHRIAKLMTLYPCVYILLTLPLSAGRMWSYAHRGEPYSNVFACIAGAFLTSCGWVDSLLYSLTRRRLLKETMPGAHGGGENGFDDNRARRMVDPANFGITHTRTVTVEGGCTLNSMDRKVPGNTVTEIQAGRRPGFQEHREEYRMGFMRQQRPPPLPPARAQAVRDYFELATLNRYAEEEETEDDDLVEELPARRVQVPYGMDLPERRAPVPDVYHRWDNHF